jgi:hypothetical protein
MQMLILGLPDAAADGFGGDQAVHNYILHSGLLAEARTLDNFERVATLHYVAGAEVYSDKDGCVVNPNGGTSEIAHQWDRHPHLTATISATALKRQHRSNEPLWRIQQRCRNRFARLLLHRQG